MSCVSACGTWHPFKSTTATTHSSDHDQELEARHLLNSHGAPEEGQDPQTKQLLRSLSRHMDILTAGSLFLLPSILPFLASAITAYTAQHQQQQTQTSTPFTTQWSEAKPSLSGNGEQESEGEDRFLKGAWILLLPCIGVMIPLVLFKIMSVLEESAFQCPFKRWRKQRKAEAAILNDVCEYDTPRGGRGGGGNARTAAAAMAAGWRGVCRFPSRNNNNNNVHASMISSCPTILAIQSVWRSWRGYPHGYGPLSLDTSTPTSPSVSASVSSTASSPCQRCCAQAQKWSQFTAPPTLPLTLVSPQSQSQLQEIDLGTPPCCIEGECLKVSKDKEEEDRESAVHRIPVENAQHYQPMQVNLELEQIHVKVVRSVLPKPRSILLTSLLAWTLLMTISSPLGLNKVDIASENLRGAALYVPALTNDGSAGPIRVPREKPLAMDRVLLDDEVEDVPMKAADLILPSPSAFIKNLRVGGFIMSESDPSEQALEEMRRIEQEEEEEAQFMDTMVSILEMDAALEAQDSDDWIMIDRDDFLNREQQQQPPIETFRTEVIFLNKRSAPATSEWEDEEVPDDLVEDAFDPDNLQAMTMDPEDEHDFRDFLLRIQAEDETQEQQQQVETAAPFVQDTMTEEENNTIPCRFRQVGSFFRNPMTLLPSAIQRLLFGGGEEEEVGQDHPFFGQASMQKSKGGHHHHVRGQVFTYINYWTDLMIFAIAMSLGGILIGLAQSRMLYQQLWDQYVAAQYAPLSPSSSEEQHRDQFYWISFVSSLLLGGSALMLTILMTLTECWDMPSLYFVGIGLAGMILVHAWVPNLSPEVEVEIDAASLYGEQTAEDHLIERDLPSPYVQVFVGEAPAYDAEEEEEEHMSNRRNACSLDESRRWEVNQSCLEPSCFSP